MNRKLARDLAAWEKGSLSIDVLTSRHPSGEVTRLTRLMTDIRALAEEPAPDPTKGWNEVRSRIARQVADEPVTLLQRLRPGLQRRLVFGLAAAILAVPPVAFAANNDAVRDEVVDFVIGNIEDVTGSFFGQDAQTAGGQSELDVDSQTGTGGNTPAGTTKGTGSVSGTSAGISEQGPTSVSGKAGGNVAVTSPPGSTSDSAALDGAGGASGESGASGENVSGSDGDTKDGADAGSSNSTSPTPSPSPSTVNGVKGDGQDSDSTPNTPSAP